MTNKAIAQAEEKGLTVIRTDTGDIKLSPKIINNYLVRGNGNVTEQETMLFLSLCKFQKLNPFLNEAYLVKFGSQPANMIVGKETFTKRASVDPRFQGYRAGIIVTRNGEILEIEGSFKAQEDILIGGWAEIHVKGRIPLKHSVSMQEYDRKQSTWKQIPCTMIRKVALVQALREAFPDLFQGMYSQEEMNVDNEYINELPKVKPPLEDTAITELPEQPEVKEADVIIDEDGVIVDECVEEVEANAG